MKRVSWLMLTLLLTDMLMLAFNIQSVKAEPTTIIVPDHYRFIQDAINVAKAGDTVYVRAGTYYEVLVVSKSIMLIGEDCETTVIDALRAGNVINITAGNVSLKGFTLRNGQNGVYISSGNNIISENIIANNSGMAVYIYGDWRTSYENKVSRNKIINNGGGVYLHAKGWGITFEAIRNTYIYGNTIEKNGWGISIFAEYCVICDYNVISGNTIRNNIGSGVSFKGRHYYEGTCCFNTVSGNTIESNSGDGVYLEESSNITISGNTIEDNKGHGVFLYGWLSWCLDNEISGNTIKDNKGHGVFLYEDNGGCDKNKVYNNTIMNNGGCGVKFYSEVLTCKSNTISKNIIANNTEHGVYFSAHPDDPFMGGRCEANIISENSIAYNKKHGVYLEKSSKNRIFHNDFIGNVRQGYVTSGYENVWDEGYPSGGNYWSDYTGMDEKSGTNQNLPGSDGICDSPYIIDAKNRDLYPIIIPRHAIPVIWGGTIYSVGQKSNSTISAFHFDQTLKQIRFNVTGPSGTQGFCNVTIPKTLLRGEPWTVKVNEEDYNFISSENATHSVIYFTYTHSSTYHVIIQGTWVIPEFPSSIILLLFMVLSLFLIAVTKRRFPRKPKHNS